MSVRGAMTDLAAAAPRRPSGDPERQAAALARILVAAVPARVPAPVTEGPAPVALARRVTAAAVAATAAVAVAVAVANPATGGNGSPEPPPSPDFVHVTTPDGRVRLVPVSGAVPIPAIHPDGAVASGTPSDTPG